MCLFNVFIFPELLSGPRSGQHLVDTVLSNGFESELELYRVVQLAIEESPASTASTESDNHKMHR